VKEGFVGGLTAVASLARKSVNVYPTARALTAATNNEPDSSINVDISDSEDSAMQANAKPPLRSKAGKISTKKNTPEAGKSKKLSSKSKVFKRGKKSRS
jgi:hypothetical protein